MRSDSRSPMNRNRNSAGFLLAMKNYGLRGSSLLIVLGLVLVGSQLQARPLSAQPPGKISTLEQRVAALEAAVTLLQQKNTELTERLAAVEAKTAPISVAGSDFTITGKNVFIQDGSGQTDGQTGLGNLTIGYNALRGPIPQFKPNARTGTHNLILGDQNNYTSFGGLVAGSFNEISNKYASVSGGVFNTASGPNASVSGGQLNVSSGGAASVGGGFGNVAQGGWSSISGGDKRFVDGESDWRGGDLFQDF
jgi:hypothetical protein